VVLVHHLPRWSEFYIETTRRFAHHGFLAICANLYQRAGDGAPDDVAAKVPAEGGVPDAQVVGDAEAAVNWVRAARAQRQSGPRYATMNTSLLCTAKGTSAFLVPFANVIQSSTGSWHAVFVAAAAMDVVVLLALFVLRPMRRAQHSAVAAPEARTLSAE